MSKHNRKLLRRAPLGLVSQFMQRQLAAFVDEPSRRTYLAVRDAVLAASPLRIAATDLAELEQMLGVGEAQRVLERLDALPPSKVLSPRVHLLAAEAAEAAGDIAGGEVERFLFVLCLQGLLATGDGSSAEPYLVCHATDEYDLLEALELKPAGQSLVEDRGQLCDVLICSNGREVWFDVTAVLQPASVRRRRKSAAARKGTLPRRTAKTAKNGRNHARPAVRKRSTASR
jgi:hypothetical protein